MQLSNNMSEVAASPRVAGINALVRRCAMGAVLIAALAVLAACGGSGARYSGDLTPPTTTSKARGLRPYKIKRVRYVPRDDRGYNKKGYASWYGPGFDGKPAANGDIFNQWALTAAHKTVPLGSYIKVTNLANGRQQVFLVNDRGPFVRGRIVDVSKRGAQVLGFLKEGTVKVRVQRTDRWGRPLTGKAQPDNPAVVAAAPVARSRPFTTAPVTTSSAQNVLAMPAPGIPDIAPSAGRGLAASPARAASSAPILQPLLVQVVSLSDFDNARRIQQSLADLGPSAIQQVESAGRTLYRVQVGPFVDPVLADVTLAKIHARGLPDATLRGLSGWTTQAP